MKDQIKELVDSSICELGVYVDDCFMEKQEGKDVLNIVLDSDVVIDLNKITEASRIINKILDEKMDLDVDEVDIYSKSKGDNIDE